MAAAVGAPPREGRAVCFVSNPSGAACKICSPTTMDELDAAAVRGKITLLPGHDVALTSVTFCIQDEDHTLGNALRYMLMKEYVEARPEDYHVSCPETHSVMGATNFGILRF